jgi:hypothetical protein
MPTRVKQKPQIRDLIADDARVVAIEGFRPYMSRPVNRGEFFRLSDGIVRQYPMYVRPFPAF